MTAAILATGEALFGLQACRDVESENMDHVNDLIQRLSSPDSLGQSLAGSLSLVVAIADEFAPLRA